MNHPTPQHIICGMDEAGRGALAGPLVAAAVICTHSPAVIARLAKSPVRDSKTISAAHRERIVRTLEQLGVFFMVEIISARRINNRGIGRANKEIFRTLIKKIEADQYIVDGRLHLGRIAGKTQRITSVVDADATILEVILAGVVAKVTRDRIMSKLHTQKPQYIWKSNSGYGTKAHIEAIQRHGTSRFHRGIFVTTALGNYRQSLSRRSTLRLPVRG